MAVNTANKEVAEDLHQQAMQLEQEGQSEKALQKYFEALRLDPSRSTTNYNIALLYKYQGKWADSFEYNKRAHELNSQDEAAIWNLGIAATALRRWDEARSAWTTYGINLEPGSGPIEMDFGITPIRLNPDDAGEVVWGLRIDPARATIMNIPLPESGFRFGDTVLHDGAPVGHRTWKGREYPVFNVLELFEASELSTWSVEIEVTEEKALADLLTAFEEARIPAEHWAVSTRWLCKACSEGRPHEQHDRTPVESSNSERRIGVSAKSEQEILDLVRSWQGEGRRLVAVELMLK